jgi:hypothetical protein
MAELWARPVADPAPRATILPWWLAIHLPHVTHCRLNGIGIMGVAAGVPADENHRLFFRQALKRLPIL